MKSVLNNEYEPEGEVIEATAMAKRGRNETEIRNEIASKTGGGKSADRATALEQKPTFGHSGDDMKGRRNLANKQRTDFRKTTSSSPGLRGPGHKSDDPEVKAKQAARGKQRGVLTPNEKKVLNNEVDLDFVNSLIESGKFNENEIQNITEILGAALGGIAGHIYGPGLLAKAGAAAALTKAGVGPKVAAALTGKTASAALGSAAGEVLDPTKKKKDKNPVSAAAGGAAGSATAGVLGASYEPNGEMIEGKVASAVGGGVGSAVGGVAGGLAGLAGGAAVGGPAGAALGTKVGAVTGSAVGGGTGAALGAKKGRKKSAAAAGAGGSLVAGPIGAATGGAIASQHEPEGDLISENPVQKAWNQFVPPPEKSANPDVRSGKLKPGSLEGPLLDKMNKGAAALNKPIKAASKLAKLAKSALPVAGALGAGVLATKAVDTVMGHGKNSNEELEFANKLIESGKFSEEEINSILEGLVGGAGTLVRQGVKIGGKKGGRAVQKGTTAATAAGRAKVASAKQGNPSKMVGSGRGEKIGATLGGIAGGLAGVAIPDGPAMVAGEIAGGYAGSKIGGKIGRQFDKAGSSS
jgi:hypothetical protein